MWVELAGGVLADRSASADPMRRPPEAIEEADRARRQTDTARSRHGAAERNQAYNEADLNGPVTDVLPQPVRAMIWVLQ